jgi:hypothetical protein
MVKVAARPTAARNDRGGQEFRIKCAYTILLVSKGMFLTVILCDYAVRHPVDRVSCPPVNPRCTPVRLRLAGGLSLVLAQNSALKWNYDCKDKLL